MKDKFLDAHGLGYFWKRIVEYVKGVTPTKTSQLENDSHYMTNGVTSFNGSTGDVTYTQDVNSVNGKKGDVILRTSDLANDSGYITTYIETDPTVPSWAKQPTKPSYTATEVGALPADTTLPEGIPAGGTTGQVLRKSSNTDYAVEWHDEEGGGGGSAGLDILELTSSTGTLTDEQFALVQSDHCMIKRATGDASNSYRYYFKAYDSDSGCDYWCDTETLTANSVTRYYFTVDYTNQEYTFGSDVDDRKRVTANPTVSGTPADLTTITVGLTSYTVAANKADKVSSATNGNFASLDSNGNLTDSGHKHSDYQTALSTQTAYTSKGSATKVPQITTNTLGQVTSITEVTITQPDISGKEDKMDIITVSATSLAPSVNKYYRFTADVGTLAVTLPTVTDTTKVASIVFYLTTGSSPNVTFTSTHSVVYQDGFQLDASKTYEVNALFNGSAWVLMAAEINTGS